jgi:molybdopterin-guanine dinucleotide biosynthesis protein B
MKTGSSIFLAFYEKKPLFFINNICLFQPIKMFKVLQVPKVVAVIGGKHSGKTTIIEHLIIELKHRGYSVGTIKEMVRIPTLDTPATETDRYRKAGAEIVVAVPRDEIVVFIKKRLSIKEIIPYLGVLDYALLEGFESEKEVPKIIAAKTAHEATDYFDNSAIAISGLITESETETKMVANLKIPILNSAAKTKELADLVEQKALNCRRQQKHSTNQH